MKRIIIMSLTIFSTILTYAQSGDTTTLTPDGKWVDNDLEFCLKNHDNTTNGSLGCLADAIDAWQGLVNSNYSTALNKLNDPHKSNLRAGQTAWLNYKTLQFKFIETYYGSLQGTEYKQMKLVAEIEILKRRAIELNDLSEE